MIDFKKINEMSYTSVTLYTPQNIDAKFIKRFRKEHDLTQFALANILGVSKKTIEKWEQGSNTVKGCAAVLLSLLAEDEQLLNKLYHVEFADETSMELCYNSETKYNEVNFPASFSIKKMELAVNLCQ